MKIFAILLLALALPAQSATLFVSKSGNGGDGFSWQTAFPIIADAIAAGASEDVLWIASATYTENLVIEKPLSLIGGFMGDEDEVPVGNPKPEFTVVDGGGVNSVCNIQNATCELRNLTIRNGSSERGAGVRCRNGKASLYNCLIAENGWDHSTRETLSGGGISLEDSKGMILNSTIMSNRASTGAGGVNCADSVVHMIGCAVLHNSARVGGGLTISGAHSEVIVDKCSFEKNVAYNSKKEKGSVFLAPPQRGGDLWIGGSAAIRNSSFWGSSDSIQLFANVHGSDGKNTEVVRARITFENCTFDLPSESPSCTWKVERDGLLPNFVNSILQGSSPFFRYYIASSSGTELIVSHSNIEGGYPGEGNIDADPRWVDQENGDYHLQRSSPCIDSGTGTGLTTDFDGKLRPIGRYDMGAFEFPYLRSDINGDGAVDAMDLLIFQEDWGLVSQP